MLWPNSGVIQTGTDTVGIQGLTTLLLDDVGKCALQDSGSALGESGAVLLVFVDTMPGCLNSMQFHSLILNEWVERPDSIGAPANTGNDNIGQLARLLEHLPLYLFSHDRLEVPNDRREGMRSHG